MFGVTILVLAAVVITLIRWIDSLARLGRVGHTIEHVEKTASEAIAARAKHLNLGARPYRKPPRSSLPLHASAVGYIQHIDVAALDEIAKAHDATVYLEIDAGSLMHPARPLAVYTGRLGADEREKLAACFVIGNQRTFEEDLRFGLVVLCEVAQRALSPGVNDPGTALDVIGSQLRLLTDWQQRRAAAEPAVLYERVYARAPSADDLIEDALAPIARDAAGNAEVQLRLQKAFAALEALGDGDFAKAARRHAKIARERALKAFTHDADRKLLERAV